MPQIAFAQTPNFENSYSIQNPTWESPQVPRSPSTSHIVGLRYLLFCDSGRFANRSPPLLLSNRVSGQQQMS